MLNMQVQGKRIHGNTHKMLNMQVQVQRIHGNTHKTFTSEDWFVGEDMDTVRVGLRHCEAPL